MSIKSEVQNSFWSFLSIHIMEYDTEMYWLGTTLYSIDFHKVTVLNTPKWKTRLLKNILNTKHSYKTCLMPRHNFRSVLYRSQQDVQSLCHHIFSLMQTEESAHRLCSQMEETFKNFHCKNRLWKRLYDMLCTSLEKLAAMF